jgi:hypothetical protein
MTEPSKFFTQHHAVEAPSIDEHSFRTFWKVKHLIRLGELYRSRKITPIAWRAGIEFANVAEIALAEQWPSAWLDERGDGGGHYDAGIAYYLDADDRRRAIERELGAFAVRLLDAHLVDDLTWAELGRRLRVHPQTAKAWTIDHLNALALSEAIWGKSG